MFYGREDLLEQASVRTALVYSGNLSPAVAADGYFDAVVNADELMFDLC